MLPSLRGLSPGSDVDCDALQAGLAPLSPREPSPEELPVARWWREQGTWDKKMHEAHSPLSGSRANTPCTQNSNAG